MIHTDSAIRFRFGLTPLEEVKPWGAGRVLHWFGLTAGWYCLDIDGHEVLRYSSARSGNSGTTATATATATTTATERTPTSTTTSSACGRT